MPLPLLLPSSLASFFSLRRSRLICLFSFRSALEVERLERSMHRAAEDLEFGSAREVHVRQLAGLVEVFH